MPTDKQASEAGHDIATTRTDMFDASQASGTGSELDTARQELRKWDRKIRKDGQHLQTVESELAQMRASLSRGEQITWSEGTKLKEAQEAVDKWKGIIANAAGIRETLATNVQILEARAGVTANIVCTAYNPSLEVNCLPVPLAGTLNQSADI